MLLKKFTAFMIVVAGVALNASIAQAAEKMKPFVLAWSGVGEMASMVAATEGKLRAGGFEVVGTSSPYPETTLIIVTNDKLKSVAAMSEAGGYAAAQRVSLSDIGGEIQIAYTNPSYMASAYRLEDDLASVTAGLESALGRVQDFGVEDGMTDDDLRGYHYMFGMEYFDEPSVLAKHDSYAAAVAAVEKGLAAATSGVTKVYRIDIPGKDETVFGVAMDGEGQKTGTMQDDAYIMSQIDFGDIKSAAHLPYEILVSGDTAYALYARFRIAINFPDLSMMGSNSFMSIMGSPDQIEYALTLVAGGTPKKN